MGKQVNLTTRGLHYLEMVSWLVSYFLLLFIGYDH
jgi:hypothetical protein